MSGVGLGLAQAEEAAETSTSAIMESTMMEGEEYYNPDETGTWTHKETVDQLCRICAKPNQYLIPIFEGEGIEHQLEPKIQKHLPIEVYETDELPLQVCYQCASTLIAWNDLVIACTEADKKLRQMHEQEEDDEDNKGAECFDEPTVDSDIGDDEPVMPSTSTAPVASNSQDDTSLTSKKAASQVKKPKLKMVLVKNPTAGPSGLKNPPKKSLSKSKDVASQDTTERLQQSTYPSLKDFHNTYQAYIQNTLSYLGCKDETKEVTWIKTEDFGTQKTVFCSYCEESFLHKGDLATHYTKIHSEKVFHCDRCDLVIKSKHSFIKHIRLHKCSKKGNTSNVATSYTDSVFCDNGDEVGEKQNISSSLIGLSCHVCGKQFKRAYHLKKHTSIHSKTIEPVVQETDRKPSEDETCCKSPQSVVQDEIDQSSTKGKETFRCELCSKNFKLRDSYKSHLRIHTGEKPFTCHICGKSFSHTGGLYYHLKHVHAGIKNHSCDLCGRSFALKAAMEDHRRIHTGERPYICHTCGKSFKTKASLYIHSKIHTDSFPHPCTYCERRFRWRQQLLAHLTTHTGEKTHLCPICGKGFGVKNDLTRHKLIHSDSKPFSCTVCGLSFGQKRYLKNHEKSRHGVRR